MALLQYHVVLPSSNHTGKIANMCQQLPEKGDGCYHDKSTTFIFTAYSPPCRWFTPTNALCPLFARYETWILRTTQGGIS